MTSEGIDILRVKLKIKMRLTAGENNKKVKTGHSPVRCEQLQVKIIKAHIFLNIRSKP